MRLLAHLITLQHKEVPTHIERWFVQPDGTVFVSSQTPMNSDPVSHITFTPFQALRQFALLTSDVEGWQVITEQSAWHKWLDNLEV